MDYNSQRPDIIIPEYGRHIQSMVHTAMQVQDREERNKMVKAIIKVMGQLFPYLRDIEDFNHKLWDHLYIMSEFKLDADSPYPIPQPSSFESKPNRLKYPQTRIKYGHYGKGVEKLIDLIADTPESEEKTAKGLVIANLMKRHYLTWNRDTVSDDFIINQVAELSEGRIKIPLGTPLVSSSDILGATKAPQPKNMKYNNKNKKKNIKR
jgi:hypothetical protein